MFPAVRTAFKDFTARFEGVVPWMYLDVKGLVTAGVGNLIDPLDQALGIPWTKPDGSLATPEEIEAEWTLVKNDPTLAKLGHKAAEKVTSLRLSDEAIEALVLKRLDANAAHLAKQVASWTEFPADAQMAILSMSWALGSGFVQTWPKFSAAMHEADWDAAAEHCLISTTGNAGVAPRNEANVLLFKNAAAVAKASLEVETLWHPERPPEAE